MSNNNDDTTVRVALRIRPPSAREQIDGCQLCTSVTPGTPQVWIGASHAFTYDYVFDTNTQQESVFECVRGLVDGCVDGYNATIIAYGQTGSGKTYTMGTGFENLDSPNILDNQGIIPRAVHYLFHQIEKIRKTAVENKKAPPDFTVNAQFVELYNEEIHDLIGDKGVKKGPSNIKIHEDATGGIYMLGVGTQQVQSTHETMLCLRNGALSRTTAATNMNDQSSRSHAIFTLHIQQRRLIDEDAGQPDFETLSAKFHFVDLAGSERLKRTLATGDRAKEGIAINSGLLVLGNVISALGDRSQKSSHVPYRNSKLTRLLQDSLGGNSRTIMIACVSPVDRDFIETLNTLKYANRARNIKNKVTINQDKSSRTIALLRQEIAQLNLELLEYKQGKKMITADGEEMETDAYHENLLLKSELEVLTSRLKALQDTVERLTIYNSELLAEKALVSWSSNGDENEKQNMSSIVKTYILEVEELRAKLMESEATCENLRKRNIQSQTILNQSLSPRAIVSMSSRPGTGNHPLDNFIETESVSHLLDAAKLELNREKKKIRHLKHKTKKKRTQETSHEVENHDSSMENDAYSSLSESDSEITETTSENECSTGTQEEIASLNDQINFKEQLIAQLEESTRRSLETKNDYERKIDELLHKIKRAEEERDILLTTKAAKVTNAQQAKAKESSLKEYESKIRKLQDDLKEMQKILREHDKLVRKNADAQKQVEHFKVEIDNMKRNKVKLMNQLKEENIKWREAENKRLKEIAQLKKDQRKKDVQIRSLESKGKLNEQLLKRKHEEVNMLRKQSKNNLSRKAAGKIAPKKTSPLKAKSRWSQIRSEMLKQASKRTTLETFENQMMNAISERTTIKELIKSLNKARDKLNREGGENKEAEINRIDDDLDTYNANVVYWEEQINELQSNIMELTASGIKDDDNGPDMQAFAEHLSKEECGYIMQKMYEDSLENLARASRLTASADQNVASAKRADTLDNLLRHIMSKIADPNDQQGISALIKTTFAEFGTPNNFGPVFPIIKEEPISPYTGKTNGKVNGCEEQEFEFQVPVIPRPPIASVSLKKARRLTSTTQELLGSIPPEMSQSEQGTPNRFNRTGSLRVPNTRAVRKNTYTVSAEDPLPRSSTDSQNNQTNNSNGTSIAGFKRTVSRSRPNTTGSAISTNNNYRSTNKERPDEFNTTFITESTNLTPPGSPNAGRRVRDGTNVFNRLTIPSGSVLDFTNQVGLIRNIRDKTTPYKSILQQTHAAEGHSKPVLAIFATNDNLLTGSKDASVKYWDLTCGKEIRTFTGYPTSVTGVQYDTKNNLIFTTSSYFIKVFDARSPNCVATLTSSGSSVQETQKNEPTGRIPAGESTINSLVISAHSNSFYSTFNERIRIWDIRSYSSLGYMSGKHISQVMCMALNYSNNTETLVTGSKDHTIKVYDLEAVPSKNVFSPVKFTLDPPHYDGIEALALSGSTLFSGSRDNCIKKWSLDRGELITAINGAHSNWVTGLCFAPSTLDYVLSASRDGMVKLWTADGCRSIGQAEIHKSGVNCIASNSSLVFTGSNEDSVTIWKIRRSLGGEPTSGDTSPTSDTS